MGAMWDTNANSVLRALHAHPSQGGFELLMLRHSKREEPAELHKLMDAPLTDEGRAGAQRFGAALPTNRKYRIYHSPVERCKETAEIVSAALSSDCNHGVEEAKFLFRIQAQNESFARFLSRDGDNIINHWIAGHYPTEEIEDPRDFARTIQQAWVSLRDLQGQDVTTIFVSHDLHTAVCLYHWSGIFRGSEDMIQPMDGFFIEDLGGAMTVVTKDGAKELAAPHWWNGA